MDTNKKELGGKITDYQLSDGSTVSKDSEYLKSLPDGSEDNNLGNLPSVSG